MKINISYENIGATVEMIPTHKKQNNSKRLRNGEKIEHIRILTFDSKNYEIKGNEEENNGISKILKNKDEEINFELVGRNVSHLNQVIVDKYLKPVNSYHTIETLKKPDGTEIKRNYVKAEGNIYNEIPVIVSNQFSDPKELMLKYLFRKSYFLIHNDQNSYGIMFNLAKKLHQKGKFVKVVSFNSKTEETSPLVLQLGGILYSAAYLEGKIRRDSEYCLVLHLSDLELKISEVEK